MTETIMPKGTVGADNLVGNPETLAATAAPARAPLTAPKWEFLVGAEVDGVLSFENCNSVEDAAHSVRRLLLEDYDIDEIVVYRAHSLNLEVEMEVVVSSIAVGDAFKWTPEI